LLVAVEPVVDMAPVVALVVIALLLLERFREVELTLNLH
jgi:hypothetical protein